MRQYIIIIVVIICSIFGIYSANAQSKEFMAIYDYANSTQVGKYRITTSQIPGELIGQSVRKAEDKELAYKIEMIYQILVNGRSYYNGVRSTFHTDISNAIRDEWTLTEPHFSLVEVYDSRMDIKLNNTSYIILSRELGNDRQEFLVYIHNEKTYDSNLTCIVGRLTLSDVTKMIIKE